MKARFRYALDPILLTRQWSLNALLVELGESNEKIAIEQKNLALLKEKVNTAYAEWQALSNVAQVVSVQRFAMHNHYIGDLLTQVKKLELHIEQQNKERDELIEKVVAAQRAVEAVEQHRDEMKARFVKLRLSGDFKIADDQWNTIQAGMVSNGS